MHHRHRAPNSRANFPQSLLLRNDNWVESSGYAWLAFLFIFGVAPPSPPIPPAPSLKKGAGGNRHSREVGRVFLTELMPAD